MNRYAIFSVILFFSLGIFAVKAQTPTLSSTGLELITSVDNPLPGQTVTITARSYSADINTAQISWVVNGKTAQTGVGSTVFQVKAPNLGKKLAIDVTASMPTGRVMNTSLTIGSGSIDLIIETDGYVPAMFRGKISPVYQNSVHIIAVPHIANASGIEYDPKTLVYQWKRNGRVVDAQSGYGQQSITLKGDIVPRGYDVSVTAWPRDNNGQAEGSISIGYQSPSIGIYRDDPLYGTLFNTAIKDSVSIGSNREVSVRTVPFGFNAQNLLMDWFINGTDHPELASSDSVVLRAPDGTAGSSDVSLDITNPREILQKASMALRAGFAPAQTTNEAITF